MVAERSSLSFVREGYSLMWPNEWGTRPYESGYGDRVVKIDWAPGAFSARRRIGFTNILIRARNRRCSWRFAAAVRSFH